MPNFKSASCKSKIKSLFLIKFMKKILSKYLRPSSTRGDALRSEKDNLILMDAFVDDGKNALTKVDYCQCKFPITFGHLR